MIILELNRLNLVEKGGYRGKICEKTAYVCMRHYSNII